MGVKPRRGNLRLVFRLFSLMRGLKTSLRLPCQAIKNLMLHLLYFTGCQFHILYAIYMKLKSGVVEMNMTGLYLAVIGRLRQLSEPRLRQQAGTENLRQL